MTLMAAAVALRLKKWGRSFQLGVFVGNVMFAFKLPKGSNVEASNI